MPWTSLDLQRRANGLAVLTMNRPAVFLAKRKPHWTPPE